MTLFSSVSIAKPDTVFNLNRLFNVDPNPAKINLAVGVYLNDKGQIPLMQSVQIAEKSRLEALSSHSYLPIEGMANYCSAVQKLLFGDDSLFLDNAHIVTVQALGGTGALRIGADFLKLVFPKAKVAISDPTWENHRVLFELSGFSVINYLYYDSTTRGLNFNGMLESLRLLPEKSIVVLHACCHNPTGIDPSSYQWEQIIEVCLTKELIPFFDMAYHGFAVNLERDSAVIRQFSRSELSFLVASSFSKNFSLYGERVGALSIITRNKNESASVLSQVKRLIRANYSNPPTHGASLVSDILNSSELSSIWENELEVMRERIKLMRTIFVSKLKSLCVPYDFSFVNTQHGMFSYSGLTTNQIEQLKAEYSIYIVPTGRICIAGLTSENIDTVTNAIKAVLC